jgi:hypothetical protein
LGYFDVARRAVHNPSRGLSKGESGLLQESHRFFGRGKKLLDLAEQGLVAPACVAHESQTSFRRLLQSMLQYGADLYKAVQSFAEAKPLEEAVLLIVRREKRFHLGTEHRFIGARACQKRGTLRRRPIEGGLQKAIDLLPAGRVHGT